MALRTAVGQEIKDKIDGYFTSVLEAAMQARVMFEKAACIITNLNDKCGYVKSGHTPPRKCR